MKLHHSSFVLALVPRATLAVMLVLTCSHSLSQSLADKDPQPASAGAAGLGLVSAPAYQGADHRRILGIPLFEYRWANGVFVGGDGLVGYQYSPNSAKQHEFGVLLGMDAGRKESASAYLRGMGDIQETVTLGGYAKARLANGVSLSVSLKMGSGNDQAGALLHLSAAYPLPLPSAVRMSLSVGTTIANESYMASNFGVSPAQAVATGYSAYRLGSGLLNTGFGIEMTYPISPSWIVMGSVKTVALQGAAKDSPLVRKVSDSMGVVGLLFAF